MAIAVQFLALVAFTTVLVVPRQFPSRKGFHHVQARHITQDGEDGYDGYDQARIKDTNAIVLPPSKGIDGLWCWGGVRESIKGL
jgi:hypothetical protein